MGILVTGASGFVGGAVFNKFTKDGLNCRAAVRCISGEGERYVGVGDIGPVTDWSLALTGMNVVVHAAARVHVFNENSSDPLSQFRFVNVDGTLNLATQAAQSGVKRFIFISSIGVNGAVSNGRAFTEGDIPEPYSPYSFSKFEAEQGLRKIEKDTGMEVVIIRPPLVYGFNAPGNIGRLLRFLTKGFPLPFGSIHNKRSFVALDNLIDFIGVCVDHPKAAGELFLIGDGADISTTELIRVLTKGMGKSVLLLPVPVIALRTGLTVLGRKSLSQQLFESCRVDISKAKSLLGWEPPCRMEAQLTKMAASYLEISKI